MNRPVDTWHLGQLVRVHMPLRRDAGGYVERLTPTLVILRDGSRWVRKTGRQYGQTTAAWIEPWGTAHQQRRTA